ncbi:MAG: class I SAM-dependent RNA methyltransferase [Spirochaetaceae bacterium]|nr:class I SAM-dependent RNA methyltransferase [Spirochaetaceae bacterium]
MELITLKTEKMLAGGDCLAKLDGKSVFVRGALPEETLKVRITADKGDFFTAEIAGIIEPSKERITPPCPFYGVCGGCNLQIASIDYQRKLKTGILLDALLRAGLNQNEVPEIKVSGGAEFGYRNRFQFHNGGLKRKSANEIVYIDDCLVAVPEIREYLKTNRINTEQRSHLFAANGIVMQPKESDGKKSGRFAGMRINEENICTVNVAGKVIQFDVHGFFQSNLGMLETTVRKITENLGGFRVADIYAGVGTFSVFLADLFKEVYLVEHNREAVVLAERNLANAKAKHESYGISGAKWPEMQAASLDFDAVVIDPPRSGMEKAVRNWIISKKVPVVRALSCDPVTFARDAADLCRNGYTFESLEILDFYPQTSHIETIATFLI